MAGCLVRNAQTLKKLYVARNCAIWFQVVAGVSFRKFSL